MFYNGQNGPGKEWNEGANRVAGGFSPPTRKDTKAGKG
jgi:hypothetical protein